MRVRTGCQIAAATLLLAAAAGPARADRDCTDDAALVKQFYEDAGLRDIYQQPWFTTCVHPNELRDPAWGTLKDVATTARNAGLSIDSIRVSYDTVRVDLGKLSYSFRLARNPENQIISVDSLEMASIGTPLATLDARLAALPGQTSLLIMHGDNEVLARNAELPLQVSSVMKLGILRTLLDEQAAGRLKLSDTVEIKPELKALPSGSLQQLPNGTAFTLGSLATLMMRDSDNTASDMLIDRLGADKVAAALGLPFIMTFHQWFMMKGDSKFYDNYRARNDQARAELLKTTEPRVPLRYTETYSHPTPAAGWFVSNRKLCSLGQSLVGSEAFELESTYVQYNEWASVASKAGGDETSRSDTLVVKRNDGEQFCVSMSWNTSEEIFDDQAYIFLLTSLMEAVRRYDVKTGQIAPEAF
jgi:hypothetical protein